MDSDYDRDFRAAIAISLAIAQKESYPKVTKPQTDKDDWPCHTCTFLNVEGLQCAVCNASRNLTEKCGTLRNFDGTEGFPSQPHENPICNGPELNSDIVDWTCLRCTLLNAKASLYCEACATCKPEPAPFHWTCVACSYINFSPLTQCEMCETPIKKAHAQNEVNAFASLSMRGIQHTHSKHCMNFEEQKKLDDENTPKRPMLIPSQSVEQEEKNRTKRRICQKGEQMSTPRVSFPGQEEKSGTVGIVRSELQLGEQIGEGSFGVVRKARWRGIEVAVKELKDVTYDIMDEFRREAHVLGQVCNHRCVVQLLGVTFLPNPALVTLYMPNGSVEDLLIKNNDAVQYHLVVQMAIEACSGLQHLHNEGVIHRDLAARNLLVDKEFHVQVSDFGLARVKNASESKGYSKSGAIPLKWSAPEAMEKKEYSEKSDVFSFGVVMFEMFMRQSPWKKIDHFEASRRVCNGERMELPDALDSDLRDLIRHCWSHEKSSRPKVPEILNFLEVYITSPKIPAERTLFSSSNQNDNEHSLHTYSGFTLRSR